VASFESVKKQNQLFICDSCKKDVKGNDVILVEASDNIEIITPLMPFVFVNKDGIITGGRKMAEKSRGDQLLACPHCRGIHLFGFSLKGKL